MAAHSLPPKLLTSGNDFSIKPRQYLASFAFKASSKNPFSCSWVGTNFPVQSSVSTINPLRKQRPIVAKVVCSLPTANPDNAESAEKVPKWSWRAIKSFAMGELEARKLKYPTTGTESIVMGILIEGTSFTSKYLRANGITFFRVRDETTKLLGKADMYFFSPEHPPLTEDAQKALDWAAGHKLKSGENGEVTTAHMLLGVWAQVDSPGYKIMAALGFDDEKA